MRNRIVMLAVISATVATTLFGLPLALAAAAYFLSQEATELEHTADIAALDVTADVVHLGRPGPLVSPAHDARLALYGPDGRLLSGDGPATADDVVAHAIADDTIQHESALGTLTAAVPIPDQAGGNYAIRASTATSGVYPRIALTWFGMFGLGVVILTLTWQLARWQARRLARPVEDLAQSASKLGDGDFTMRADPSGISEIDTAATALNQAAERISDLVERERAVTAHASHQLRTPLAGLRLCLENALATPGADFRAATREAIASADRLEHTIDDLISLARVHVDRRPEPLDIAALLREIDTSWHALLAKEGRSLSVRADPGNRPVRASGAAVRQILAVLVDNAVHHGSGRVDVHARETIGSVAVDVCDQGSVDVDDAVFIRSSATGRGMGLPLARSLAEAEGARLVITGRNPTTFTLFLPEAD
ncbi:HAMP domain-containing sensor histidine kinase [Mycobacterium sp.]|uniref:HAMP domain-containing sensor histidine kinase n=1 Tax=Mycobacterium sp. TaxID=1785 RepID=UPI002D49593B|nr:HAMP domain-containing sensor histidine kinase [Mycobacterium sp.]HZA12268.1 HAMP domain-containing sensor histidine kinase [Mycobacterium sp.]